MIRPLYTSGQAEIISQRTNWSTASTNGNKRNSVRSLIRRVNLLATEILPVFPDEPKGNRKKLKIHHEIIHERSNRSRKTSQDASIKGKSITGESLVTENGIKQPGIKSSLIRRGTLNSAPRHIDFRQIRESITSRRERRSVQHFFKK